MNNQKNNSVGEQIEQLKNTEAAAPAAEKKPFVEPTVSVPVDVLEATALFQAPTVTVAGTN